MEIVELFLERGLALRVQASFSGYWRGSDLIVDLYQSNSGIIDFLLFFLLFTGLAKFTLGNSFQGAGCSLLSLAVGLILSISLIITQEYIGFRLMNFGPYAAFLALFLIGIVSYNLLSSIGFSSPVALSIAYLLLYGSVRAFLPNIFEWSMRDVPFMAGLLSLGALIAIGALLFSVMPRLQDASFGSISSLAPVASIRSIGKLDEEAEAKAHSVHITGKDIFEKLKKLRSYLPSLFPSEHGRAQILEALSETSIENHNALEQFKRLRSIHQAVRGEDIASLQKLLKMRGRIPKQDLGKVARYIRASQERLNIERTLESVDRRISSIMERFEKTIEAAVYSVQRRDGKAARQSIDAAIRMESQLLRALKPAEELEHKLKASFQRVLRNLGNSSKKKV